MALAPLGTRGGAAYDQTMPLWLQHTLVLIIVVACVAVVIVGVVRTFWGRRSRLGNCCSKGCSTDHPPTATTAQAERVVFFPADSLRLRPTRAPSED